MMGSGDSKQGDLRIDEIRIEQMRLQYFLTSIIKDQKMMSLSYLILSYQMEIADLPINPVR